ncbi:MAG: glycosyltransferase family 2 protein, partial [Verrucomicrobiota bacterium]|nr:glycosyltransferase family 2 protein [Verrucomicrobiota bacterium]
MTKTSDWLTIIIPAFNEEEGIASVLDGVLRFSEENNWTVLVVDDGSTDATPKILGRYGDRIRTIRHSSSRGYGASLKSGIMATRSENVLLLMPTGSMIPLISQPWSNP